MKTIMVVLACMWCNVESLVAADNGGTKLKEDFIMYFITAGASHEEAQ